MTSARDNMAMQEIQRHVQGHGGDSQKSQTSLLQALDLRQEYQLDELRFCFHDDNANDGNNDSRKWRELLMHDFKRQPMLVCAHDNQSRAVVYKSARRMPWGEDSINHEAYLLAQLYVAERAIAVSEYHNNTRHHDDDDDDDSSLLSKTTKKKKNQKITVLFSFQSYSSSNAPALSTLTKSTVLLQQLYPERLQSLCILDPPFWMRATYNLIYPFLSEAVCSKVKLVSGSDAIEAMLTSTLDSDNRAHLDAISEMIRQEEVSSSTSTVLQDMAKGYFQSNFWHIYKQ